MFQIGTDFEFGHLNQRRNRNAMIVITVASVCVPFALGFAIGQFSAPHLAPHIDALAYSLFCGVGLAITAVPIPVDPMNGKAFNYRLNGERALLTATAVKGDGAATAEGLAEGACVTPWTTAG